jgi:site-specific recombinase XerC
MKTTQAEHDQRNQDFVTALTLASTVASISRTPAPQDKDLAIEQIAGIAVLTLNSPHSRTAYSAAISRFIESGHPITRTGVLQWLDDMRQCGKGTVTLNIHLQAVRLLARECYERGLVDAETISSLERIKSLSRTGQRAGNWLELPAVKLLLQAAHGGEHGVRNRALVACMIGCGLRRSEVVSLDWSQWQKRQGRWCWIDVLGKGQKLRTVPCPNWVAGFVEEWKEQEDRIQGEKK